MGGLLALSRRYPEEGAIYTGRTASSARRTGSFGLVLLTGTCSYSRCSSSTWPAVLAYAARGAESTLVTTRRSWRRWRSGGSAGDARQLRGRGVAVLPNVGPCARRHGDPDCSAGAVRGNPGSAAAVRADLPSAGEIFRPWRDVFGSWASSWRRRWEPRIKTPSAICRAPAMAAGALTLAVYVSVTWALQQLVPAGDIRRDRRASCRAWTWACGAWVWSALPHRSPAFMAVWLAGGLAGWSGIDAHSVRRGHSTAPCRRRWDVCIPWATLGGAAHAGRAHDRVHRDNHVGSTVARPTRSCSGRRSHHAYPVLLHVRRPLTLTMTGVEAMRPASWDFSGGGPDIAAFRCRAAT